MAEPFLGEVRLMSFAFAPQGWAQCNGQLLPINQNQALFSLLGTNFGGNGQTHFALPDLRGRVPIHVGPDFSTGQHGGEQAHTLSLNELPSHGHLLAVSDAPATTNSPSTTAVLAQSVGDMAWGAPNNLVALGAQAIGSVGGGQAHTNMQPHLVMNFCIAIQGIFPSRN